MSLAISGAVGVAAGVVVSAEPVVEGAGPVVEGVGPVVDGAGPVVEGDGIGSGGLGDSCCCVKGTAPEIISHSNSVIAIAARNLKKPSISPPAIAWTRV